jgi:hypothetical protein
VAFLSQEKWKIVQDSQVLDLGPQERALDKEFSPKMKSQLIPKRILYFEEAQAKS